jgi:hypothetical protein
MNCFEDTGGNTMKRYKLTTQDMKTRKGYSNETTWEIGKWVESTGDIAKGLCSDAYIHWYSHPLLAVLLNPIHANIENPRLWEVETDGKELTNGHLKGGSRRVRLIQELPIPEITTEQRVRFAILCAKRVYEDEAWNAWADEWLSGANQSYVAAYAAANTHANAYAAVAVAYAAANADADVAAANADAAVAAANADATIDLIAIAEEAIG